jgi:hypothetical protein
MPPPQKPDDDYDEVPQPPPHRRFQPEDEGDDYDYDRPRRRYPQQLSWIEQQFGQTSIVILVLFPLLCGIIALVFGIVGVCLCQEPLARRNAIIVLVIGLISGAVTTVLVVTGKLAPFR